MRSRNTPLFLLAVLTVLGSSLPASGQSLYVLDNGRLDGGGPAILRWDFRDLGQDPPVDPEIIFRPDGGAGEISLDPSCGMIYFTSGGRNAPKLGRVDLAGGNAEILLSTGMRHPYGIAVDHVDRRMYWTDRAGSIHSAELDGSGARALVTEGLEVPTSIAVDSAGGKVYWTDVGTDKVYRADLDGGDVEILVARDGSNPFGIAIDSAGGKMYWTNAGGSPTTIERANLDGSAREILINRSPGPPGSIVLDLIHRKMYWPSINANERVFRADLDGSNIELLLIRTQIHEPRGLVLDLNVPAPCITDEECDNGVFCDGVEVCRPTEEGSFCSRGTCPCGDVGVCDEENRECDECNDPGDCDDGVFCNGPEQCSEAGDCLPGEFPCIHEDACDEESDVCRDCQSDSDCDDGVFCNGAEFCDEEGLCRTGADPCAQNESCLERLGSCFPRIPPGFELARITDDGMYNSGARINECGQIVFVKEMRGTYESREIFLYENGVTTRLTDDNDADEQPDINDSGTVTWTKNAPPRRVWLFEDGEARLLFDGASAQINNAGHIAYRGEVDGDFHIFLYDGTETRRVSLFDGFSHQSPRLNDRDEIVWVAYDFEESPYQTDIMMYSEGQTLRLTEDQIRPVSPDINDASVVAWSPADEAGEDYIELWHAGETEMFTDWGSGPKINNSGHVAFHRWDQQRGAGDSWLSLGGETLYRINYEGATTGSRDINDSGELVVFLNFGYPNTDLAFLRRIRSGDVDFDGDVDADDFAVLFDCLTGPGGRDGLCGCRFLDIDHDGDVDVADYAAFQANYTGEP